LTRMRPAEMMGYLPASAGGAGDEDLPIPPPFQGRDATEPNRLTNNLEAMKIAELCLKHDHAPVYSMLSPKPMTLLAVARKEPLEPPDDYEMLELPFVLRELGQMFRAAGFVMHPTIWGPYLLELVDPFGRVVVEWDANWLLYPPWRRQQHEDWVRRKHRYLQAEGWRVACVPLAQFQELENSEEKVDFVVRFAQAQGLDGLRMEQSLWQGS